MSQENEIPVELRGQSAGPEPVNARAVIATLSDHLVRLARETPGPLDHITIDTGEARAEVTWAPAAPAPTVHGAVETHPPAAAATHYVTAPTVGRLHRAPRDGAPTYVRLGEHVEPTTVVATVETMRSPAPVLAGVRGTVVETLVPDDRMVEFDQPLIAITPDTH